MSVFIRNVSRSDYFSLGSNKVSADTRLYTWSVIFELLLYFTVPLFSLEPGVGRFLQVLVLLVLAAKLLHGSSFPKPAYFNLFAIYYFLALIAILVAVLRGFYPLGLEGAEVGSSNVHTARTSMSPILNGALEYIILLYYFVYFVIFPQLFIRTRSDVKYVIDLLIFILLIVLVVGFADYVFTTFDKYYLTKSLFNETHVGNRFHSLVGEPRHAFAFLVMGLGFLYLRKILDNKKVSALWIASIVAAMIATKSFSGLVAVVIFLFIFGIYSIFFHRSVKLVGIYAISFSIVSSFLIYFAQHDERLSIYANQLPVVWGSLEKDRTLPWPYSVQGRTIYPLHDLTVKVREFDFVPVLIGSGLGSASVLSNLYSDNEYLILNPSSQLVRVIYETGVIGFFLFLSVFLGPTIKLTSNFVGKQRNKIIAASLFVLAAGLAQRHVGLYIFFGVMFVSFRIYWAELQARRSVKTVT